MERKDYPTDTSEVARLLYPYPVDRFLQHDQGRSVLHVPGGPAKASAFFSWQELNRILAEHRLEPPRLRLAANGRMPGNSRLVHPPGASGGLVHRGLDAYALNLEALYAQLREGATLVLDAVDEANPGLARLCADLARCFLTHAQANAYASFGATYGFGLHWDNHDVIVLQVAGRKNWRVFPPTLERPLAHDEQNDRRPIGVPSWEGELRAGDLLYLPRGWWHAPRGIGEPSLHLTFALPLPTGLDVLDWLLQRAARVSPIVRQDLPSRARPEDQQAFARALRAEFDRLWDEEIVDTYLDYRAGRLGPRPWPSLPEAVSGTGLPADDDFAVRYNGVAAVIARPTCEEAGSGGGATSPVRITMAGRECVIDPLLLPVMERLLGREAVRFAVLLALVPDAVGRDGLRDLLGGLTAAGLLDITPDGRGS